jgi:cell wall-associated NlpC family hydrolase
MLSATTMLVVGSCASAAVSDEAHAFINFKTTGISENVNNVNNKFLGLIIQRHLEATMLEAKLIKQQQIRNKLVAETKANALHKAIINQRISDLNEHIGKTWYVFSGSTPRGWDCSGLVVWFYEGLGITLPHSATKQGMIKPKAKNPIPGDIVVTKYKNFKNFIHSGIYIGNNKMIHAGFRSGQKTEIIDLDDPSFDNQKHYFVRIIGD